MRDSTIRRFFSMVAAMLVGTSVFLPALIAISIVIAHQRFGEASSSTQTAAATANGESGGKDGDSAWLENDAEAIAKGAAVGVLAWILLSVAVSPLARADRANVRQFEQMRSRLQGIDSQLSAETDADSDASHESKTRKAALAEAVRYKKIAEDELGLSGSQPAVGLRWVNAIGYNRAWAAIYSAEEALIEARQQDELVHSAMHEYLRLRGSNIPSREYLRARLRDAVRTLDPEALPLFEEIPPLTSSHADSNRQSGGNAKPGAERVTPDHSLVQVNIAGAGREPIEEHIPAPNGAAGELRTASTPDDSAVWARLRARGILREVRQTINQYRTDRWDGLVAIRNRVVARIVAMGLAGTGLLAVALVMSTTTHTGIDAVAVLFLVGMVVGLAQQLAFASSENANDVDVSEVEDYGLSTMRLISRAYWSGLAAVFGVWLVAVAPSLVGTENGSDTSMRLSEVFDIGKHPVDLLVAAVFGLTPELLLTRIQQKATEYKGDLKSSSASDGSTGSA